MCVCSVPAAGTGCSSGSGSPERLCCSYTSWSATAPQPLLCVAAVVLLLLRHLQCLTRRSLRTRRALGLLQRFITNGREADGSATRDRLKMIPRYLAGSGAVDGAVACRSLSFADVVALLQQSRCATVLRAALLLPVMPSG